jgi:hypothetical protein
VLAGVVERCLVKKLPCEIAKVALDVHEVGGPVPLGETRVDGLAVVGKAEESRNLGEPYRIALLGVRAKSPVTVDRSSGQVTFGPAACSALRQGCLATEVDAEGPCVAGLSFATIVAVGARLIRRTAAGPFAVSNPGRSRGVDPG